MITKKTCYFLVFSILLGSFSFAYGAVDDTRFLVKSDSGFWKKSFGVRHNFSDGFTTDLSPWQLRVAKVFGVEVVPVVEFYILPEADIGTEADVNVKDIEVNNAIEVNANVSVNLNEGSEKGNENSKGPDKPGKPVPSPSPTNEPEPSPTPGVSNRPHPSDQFPWGVEYVYGSDPILNSVSGGGGVGVAVLDTGVFREHLDLTRRILGCKDFTHRKKPVIDGQCDDKNGHGTHVAGIIAADSGFDGKGIYGVAPGVGLFAYKVCGNNGSCWSDDIAMAIRTAADSGVNIINLSLGSDSPSSLINNAISYAVSKNVLVVAAAGNDGPYIGSIDYPGADSDVVAVGAFDVNLDIVEWSSRGTNTMSEPYVSNNGDIEFAAPGVNVESTWKDGNYVILSGTSMATPHMTGLAAKLWQKDAEDPDSATRDLLHQFSQDLSPFGDDNDSGWGFPHL